MGNIIYFSGKQLCFVLKVAFHQRGPAHLELKFGPFHSERSIAEWRTVFLDEFLKSILLVPGVEDCVKSSESLENFDPDDIEVIKPGDPLLDAWEIVNLYFDGGEILGGDSGLANRYYDWVAILRFDFENLGTHFQVKERFGPLNDPGEFKRWWPKFKKGVREKAAEFGGIRFRVLNGEFEELEDFSEEGLGEDFFEITCWDPEEMGRAFLSEILRRRLRKRNSLR